jgi:biopolymer transport protein ExbB/TolQ
MTDRLVEILYFISAGLLLPTLVILLLFMAGTLLMLGGLLRELVERRAIARQWRGYLNQLRVGKATCAEFYDLRLNGYPAQFQSRTATVRENPLVVRKCLDDLEIDITRRLSWLAFATRLGPMLGLVGTLVPLGPALTGMASGDIQALSGNLVIAFTTTVFGILVGGFAYAVTLIRRAWYEQDLSDLEFIASLQASVNAAPRLASAELAHDRSQLPQEFDDQNHNGETTTSLNGDGLVATHARPRHAQ